MDLFGVGGAEVLVILLVAFLVLGPSRIVRFAQDLGRLARRARQASDDLTSAVRREVTAEQKKQPSDNGKQA
jgi:sec-independent protein translocase protein TatB